METAVDYIEPPTALPIQPQQVVPQAAAYFPVDVEYDHYQRLLLSNMINGDMAISLHRTDFNFIQESMIDTKPILPVIPASVPMPVHTAAAVPASLASMDSAVVMVHSQMPHLAYPHFAAYPTHPASIVPGPSPIQVPPTSQQAPQQLHQQPLPSNDLPTGPLNDTPSAPPTTQTESQENRATTSSPWAEEPQDDIPTFQQEPNRGESNTWVNSNYRPNDQGEICFVVWFPFNL